MLNKGQVFAITVVASALIILLSVDNSVFAMHHGEPHQEKMGKMSGHHHTPHHGVCAPGFASLGDICVLNDRCGPGAYAGKVCVMDGVMQPYLRPLHQKHAGISVDNIICSEGKQLMFKSHNASPGCVKSASVEKLKQRGWQSDKPDMACTLEYNPVCGIDGVTYGNPCMMQTQHMAMKHPGECIVSAEITSFEECVAAGNPVMESYPRQCRTSDGQHFVEVIPAFAEECDLSYPDVCIPSPPPDLNCDDIEYENFKVFPPDPHGFDGDGDGIGCETS